MICRRFRPEDKPAVISVLRASIDDWQGDWAEAYWEWKFERNPRGPGRIWVGDDGAGSRAAISGTPSAFGGATRRS